MKVDVLFVTDMSGSMASRATAVRDGFNDYIKELRTSKATKEAKYKVTLTTFADEADKPITWKTLASVPVMDEDLYQPGGMTALLDAVGGTIEGYTGNADKVVLVIQTDGYENASKRYTRTQVSQLLRKVEQDGWMVLFLAQGGEEVLRDATTWGIKRDAYIGTRSTVEGTRSGYRAATVGTNSYVGGQSVNTSRQAARDVVEADGESA